MESITGGNDRSARGFDFNGGNFKGGLSGLWRLGGGSWKFNISSAIVLAADKVGRWREGRSKAVAVAASVVRREIVVEGAVGAQQAVANAISTRSHPQDHKKT